MIIETSYMLDLASAEEGLHTTLLTQFTFICFFVIQFPYGGFISFCINIATLFILILLYSYVARRTISERKNNLEIWITFYNVISYFGIIFNAVALVKGQNEASQVFKEWFGNESTFLIFATQNGLLLSKFLLSILVPKMPVWVYNRVVREEENKARYGHKRAEMIHNLKKGEGNVGNSLLSEEEENLRFYFENQEEVKGFVKCDKGDFGGEGSDIGEVENLNISVGRDKLILE